MRVSFRVNALSAQHTCRGAAGTGVFSVCSAGADCCAAGAGMFSFLDLLALKASSSYICELMRRSFYVKRRASTRADMILYLLSRGRRGIFKIRRGDPHKDTDKKAQKAFWPYNVHYSPIYLKIQVFSTFFPILSGHEGTPKTGNCHAQCTRGDRGGEKSDETRRNRESLNSTGII